MFTKKTPLNGSERKAPPHGRRAGTPSDEEQGELTIMVRRRAQSAPDAGHTATVNHTQFEEQFGADPADIDKVKQYVESQGLHIAETDAARRAVIVQGSLGQLKKAFDADVQCYEQEGQTFRVRVGHLSVPAELKDVVEGIFGFDERPQARTRLRFRDKIDEKGIRPKQSGGVSYSPPELAKIYQFPDGNGSGETIGIIELGGGFKQTDLHSYFSNLGISPAPKVTSVSVDKGKNKPSGNPNSADGEVLLDIEVVGAIATGAHIVVYFAPNTTRGFLDAITTAIHDTKNHPSVISISWGGPEDTYTGQALTSYDQAFQDARLLGVTICVAAGDSGSTDGETDGNQHVDFPASSPNVLACGGTSLQAANGSITSEQVWNDGAQGGATGGGISENFPVPDYQSSVNVPPSANSSHFKGRGVPDVAAVADPATGYDVLVDGSQIVVGGTSAVAPLWAALIAIINQQHGASVGFVHPALYANKSAFHDITSGNNGAYSARAGWDPCTGLGSPIGTAVAHALQAAKASSGSQGKHRKTPQQDALHPNDLPPHVT